MKKFVILVLGLLCLLTTSCYNSNKFPNEKEKLLEISKESYMEEFTLDGITGSMYLSNTSPAIYFMYEAADKYVAEIDETFYTKDILVAEDSKEEIKDINPIKHNIIYNVNSNIITIDNEEKTLESTLDFETFKQYCANLYGDTLVSMHQFMYDYIHQVISQGEIVEHYVIYKDGIGDLNLFVGRVSVENIYYKRIEYVYLDFIKNYVNEKEYEAIYNNLDNLTMYVQGHPGYVYTTFYVSLDYNSVFPYINAYYDDTYFFNGHLLDYFNM